MHYMLSILQILILPQHTTGPPLVRPTTRTGEPPSTESMTQPTMSQRSNTVDNHATTDPSLLPTRITSDFSSVEPAILAYIIYARGGFGALIGILLVLVVIVVLTSAKKEKQPSTVLAPVSV